jgi:geranylgeranyl pyrophosphate synthase
METLGKPIYEDLLKGIITAPYLFALETKEDMNESLLTLLEIQKIKKEKIKNLFKKLEKEEKDNGQITFIEKTQHLVNNYLENVLVNLNNIIPIKENYEKNIYLQDFIKLILFIGTREK